MSKLLLTSGYTFDNYVIRKYIDFCSGECALGTGFLSSLEAGISDILGSSSTLYKDKLSRAKNMALEDLKRNALSCGANAIIGLDVDYTTFSADIMGVIANGTAVYIEPLAASILDNSESLSKHMVIDYNPDLSFRPHTINLMKNQEDFTLSLELLNFSEHAPEAIDATLSFNTIFNDSHCIEHIYFIHFEKEDTNYTSAPTTCILPAKIIPILKNISVKINKHITNGSVSQVVSENKTSILDMTTLKNTRSRFGADSICEYSETESEWICICGTQNNLSSAVCSFCSRKRELLSSSNFSTQIPVSYVTNLMACNSAKEIAAYTKSFNKINHDIIPAEIFAVIERYLSFERMYGNAKEDCMKAIKNELNNLSL